MNRGIVFGALAMTALLAAAQSNPYAPSNYPPEQNPFDKYDLPPPPPKKIWPLEGSYAKCILDKMPGVANDLAASKIVQQCKEKYPELLNTIESGRPLGFDGPGDCIAKKARDTVSQLGARAIGVACYHRYRADR